MIFNGCGTIAAMRSACLVSLATMTLLTGCSSSPDPAESARTLASTADTTASTTAAPQSAFCVGLRGFNVVLLRYAAEVGGAIRGEPIDVAEARRVGDLVAQQGALMKDSVPADIADAFRAELDAVATSLANIEAGKTAREVVDPIYNAQSVAAREALERYDCG